MYLELSRIARGSKKGQPTANVSAYQPDKKTKEFIARVVTDFQTGYGIMNRSFKHFNDRSVIQQRDIDLRAFNNYVPPRSEDPDESWRAQTIRPVTRNKIISIAAHVTAQIIFPNVFAQNERDQEDQEAATVMRDLIEWVVDNSDYSRQFILGVIAALVSPATVIKMEFAEAMRTIKTRHANGEITSKQAIDDVFSGFITSIVPVDELFIANIYEANIQKQRFLIRRRFIDINEARALHGNKTNFSYVQAGMRHIYAADLDTFYEQFDSELTGLVEECTYYHRGDDLEVTFLNGVPVDSIDNPNRRLDKRYPFAKGGYEPIGEGAFFYYKSCAAKLGPDQELVDTLYNMVMDGTFMSLMPPMALYGNEEVGASVLVPGSVTSFNESSKLETIGSRSDIRGGLEVIGKVESSITESSQDVFQQGVSSGGGRTAFEISALERNAAISLGLFGKMIRFLVEDIGDLMISDILQHLTVAEVSELTGVQYKKFILSDKMSGGKKVSKEIRFQETFGGAETTSEEDILKQSFDLFEEEGGPDAKKQIALVNPTLFVKNKFKTRVAADAMKTKSEALEKALNLEFYDRLIQNPLTDQDEAFAVLVDQYKVGESKKFKSKNPPQQQMQQPQQQQGVTSNLTGQITGSNSLGNAMSQG